MEMTPPAGGINNTPVVVNNADGGPAVAHPLSKGGTKNKTTTPSAGPRLLETVICSVLVVAVVALLWELLVVSSSSSSSAPEEQAGGAIATCQQKEEEGLVWRELVLDDTAYRRVLGAALAAVLLLCCAGKIVADGKVAAVVRVKLRKKLEDSFDRPSTVEHAWTRLGWHTRVGVGVVTVFNVILNRRCVEQQPTCDGGGGGGSTVATAATAAAAAAADVDVAQEMKEGEGLSEDAGEVSNNPNSTAPKLLTVRSGDVYLRARLTTNYELLSVVPFVVLRTDRYCTRTSFVELLTVDLLLVLLILLPSAVSLQCTIILVKSYNTAVVYTRTRY